MTFMTFRERLVELRACNESIEWVGNKTIEEAWKTCENPQWMLWVLTKTNLDLIDPLCDIAERVLHLVPKKHKLVCSNAISAARRRASIDELNAAFDAASVAAYAANAAYYAARAVAALASIYAAVYNTGSSHYTDKYTSSYYASCIASNACAAHSHACCSSIFNAAYDYAYNEEYKNQCDIFRKYFTIDQVKEAFNKLVA